MSKTNYSNSGEIWFRGFIILDELHFNLIPSVYEAHFELGWILKNGSLYKKLLYILKQGTDLHFKLLCYILFFFSV